jgi:regulator of sigma E protease
MDLIGLIPSFGNVLYTIAAFVVALSVIVAIHEYGHYIVGRWSGIKAEIFSVGFGPVLFKRTDRHGTQWQVAALPFGGYVKFMGDANAASAPDSEVVKGLTPDERRMTIQGAPLWARAATVAAGPIFNFALSILVFAGMLMIQGVAKEPLTIDTLRPMPFEPVELRPGDEIVEIEGTPAPPLEDLIAFIDTLPLGRPIEYTVRRDGNLVEVEAPWSEEIGALEGRLAAALVRRRRFPRTRLDSWRRKASCPSPCLRTKTKPNVGLHFPICMNINS